MTRVRRTAVVWRACGQRMALQLATVLIMVTGCSDDSDHLASDSTMEKAAQAVPTVSPAPQLVQTTSSENVIVPDVFASMWDYNEEEPFHNDEVEGILLIEGPCVYVIDDYAWLFPSTPLEEIPDPVRILINLPRSQTQYDPVTQSIWVHDYGPVASGDRIELVGGGIGPSLPDVCSSRVDRAFNVKSMTLKRCALWFEPDHWVQSGCHSTVSDPLAGLWDYDENAPSPGYLWEGTLLIEYPCVYVIDDDPVDTPSEQRSESRAFIELPREQTRYDPDSQSIWVHNQGPMTNGDRVEPIGIGRSLNPSDYTDYGNWSWDRPYDSSKLQRLTPDICSDNVNRMFTATHMSPKQCGTLLLHEHQTRCRPADLLAGMWDYNPARPSHAPAAEGVLLIEGPCVYVIDDFMWLVPGVPLEELPDPVRVFVNLPRAQTHYDPNTDTIRVHDQGPMASGDRVQMAGGADRSVPDACSADVDRVFTATHMSPKQCTPWVPPGRQTGCKPTETP